MSPLVVPALALLAGAACGVHLTPRSALIVVAPVTCIAIALWASLRGHNRAAGSAVAAIALVTGLAMAASARSAAMNNPLRVLLDQRVGGFRLETLGPPPPHDPILTRFALVEDAAWSPNFTSLRADARQVRLAGRWHSITGGITVSVSGSIDAALAGEWTAGRVLEAPVTFRRPARYLNDGVPDMELDLALDGTTLFGSIKSGLLLTQVSPGSRLQEAAARVRRDVRLALERSIAPYSDLSAAIVAAVLIGDRTGLPDDVRLRLQAAGTYHVIAISGGNIAVFAGLTLGVCMLLGVSRRAASGATIAVLLAYAQVVNAGPSVWRATTMAVVYLAARTLDHRSLPWHACATAALIMTI